MQYKTESAPNIVWYHASSEHFDTFSITTDIGFHFGTEAAAKARYSAGIDTQVSLHESEINPIHKECLKLLESSKPTPTESLFITVASRSDSPKPHLMSIINTLTKDEIESTYQQFSKKTASLSFVRALVESDTNKPPIYKILRNDKWISSSNSLDEAKKMAEALRINQTIKVNVSNINVIRLPDLGVWPPNDIVKHLYYTEREKSEYNALSSNDERYDHIRKHLIANDIRGIIYENKVENKGKDSIIVFLPSDIVILNAPLPKPHPHTDEFINTFNSMITSSSHALEAHQLRKEIDTVVSENLFKIEDIFIAYSELKSHRDIFIQSAAELGVKRVQQRKMADFVSKPNKNHSHFEPNYGPRLLNKR